MGRTILAVALLAALTGPAAAEPVPGTVKIGILVDISSVQSAADGVGSLEAARMAVEDYGGKVLGRPVEIVAGDHRTKPDLAGSIARQWMEQGVAAVVGGGASSATLAALTVMREKNRPFLFTSQATMALTNEACSPIGIHFTYDAYSLSKSVITPMMGPSTDTWFFITANYSGGIAIEDSMSAFITGAGGKVLGSTRNPLGDTDFSSHLLKAQGSKAKVVGVVNFQSDLVNLLKQAGEFGVGSAGGQVFAVPLIYLNDVKGLGLKATPPLATGMSFYWDFTDETRAFARKFAARMNGQYPEEPHVGTYTAVLHYLKALEQTNDVDGKVVVDKMKAIPVNDFWNKDTRIREDGRVMHPFYLMQVKTEAESKGPYDYFKVVKTMAPEDAFQPLAESKCPLIKKS